MAENKSVSDFINAWAKRRRVEQDTMKVVWPFQLIEFAACEIWTQNARIEGWFGKNGAPMLGGEMEREHNYLVSCALIRQAVFKIKDEQWDLSKKAMIYTSTDHLKTLLARNELVMERVKRDTSELHPVNLINIHVSDILTRLELIEMWFRHSNADIWDREVKNFQTSLDIINAAVDVIMEEIEILEKYCLKYQLSDDFH